MCEHKNSEVKDSRPKGYVNRRGAYVFFREYPYLIYRRRECMDCGVKFSTVEMFVEYIDERLDPKQARKEILAQLINFLSKQS